MGSIVVRRKNQNDARHKIAEMGDQITRIDECYQIFHNFIRTHEGLEGKTPAKLVGLR